MTQNPFAPKQPVDDVDAFLMGGGGVSAKFPTVGHVVTGVITDKRVVQQRDYDDASKGLWWVGSKKTAVADSEAQANGYKPVMQAVLTLQCEPTGYTYDRAGNKVELADDDGMRNLYVKGQMQKAISDAIRKAGAKGPEIGGRITVTYVGTGKQDNPKYNPPKVFTAEYTPAAQVQADDALMGGAGGGTFVPDVAPNPFAA